MTDPFTTVERTAFRVESLPDYPGKDGPSESMLAFERTGKTPTGHNDDWREVVAGATARGATVCRLRLVSRPLSRYERYEIYGGYDKGVSAGEIIRIAYRDENPEPEFGDFWSFDDEIFRKMNYDPDGRWVDFEDVNMSNSLLQAKRQWFARWEEAVPLDVWKAGVSG